MRNALCIVLLGLFTQLPLAPAADFDCQAKTLVLYSPGPNWKDLEKYIDGHLSFLEGEYRSGHLLFAGPVVGDDGNPVGGASVFNLAEPAETEALVRTESFAIHGVVSYEVKRWNLCTLKN